MTSRPKSKTPSLFAAAGLDSDAPRPLADKLRPDKLADVVGQDHLLGPDGALTRMLESRSLGSLIFWGPPGTGKTTVARLLAQATESAFRADLGDLFRRRRSEEGLRCGARARARPGRGRSCSSTRSTASTARSRIQLPAGDGRRHHRAGRRDHRKPVLRADRAAAVARARAGVQVARRRRAIEKLLHAAEAIEGKKLPLDDEARASLIRMADGDGRASLTLAEEVWRAARAGEVFDAAALAGGGAAARADLRQEAGRPLQSDLALHKSVRGSDPDAALYYLARMLDAGEDPLYLARRIVRMAVEDIGLADPQALVVANAAKDAYDFLGSPEGELALAEAVIYVATAPKSNAAYMAFGAAKRTAKEAGSLLPPKHILNAPTKLMKTEGYGSATNTTTTAKTRSPDRTISRKRSAASSSTIRPNAASSVRSGSGWTIGRSSAANGADVERRARSSTAGRRQAVGRAAASAWFPSS